MKRSTDTNTFIVPVTEVYGCNSFSNAAMKEWLPKSVFSELLAVQAGEKELALDVADVVASAMKAWAIQDRKSVV